MPNSYRPEDDIPRGVPIRPTITTPNSFTSYSTTEAIDSFYEPSIVEQLNQHYRIQRQDFERGDTVEFVVSDCFEALDGESYGIDKGMHATVLEIGSSYCRVAVPGILDNGIVEFDGISLQLVRKVKSGTMLPTGAKCKECKKVIGQGKTYQYADNNFYCSSCSKLYARCYACSKFLQKTKLQKTKDGSYFCTSCMPINTIACIKCEHVFNRHTTSLVRVREDSSRKRYACNPCFSRYYFVCRCDHMDKKVNGKQCRYCHRWFDPHCFIVHTPDHCDGRENIYTFYEGKEPGRLIDVKRFIGLEIEAERGSVDELAGKVMQDVRLAHDGSLDHETGIEIQTPPASLDKLEELVVKTCQALKATGYKGTQNCGLHVHIDCRDIVNQPEKITQLIKTFYSIEDLLYSMLPPSRWENKYCKRLSKSYLFGRFTKDKKRGKIETEWYKESSVYEKEKRKQHKYEESRYTGFNLHSLFYRDTLELRYHSGTVREEKILNWVYILLHIFDWAINHYDESMVTRLFDTETNENKLDMFFQAFSIRPEVREYMVRRVRKFNRGYAVKFNKGKLKREMEKEKNDMLKEGLQAKLKELRKEYYMDNSVKKKYEQYKKDLQRIEKEETGFITDTEILQALNLLTTGTEIRESGSDDEEQEEVRSFQARV